MTLDETGNGTSAMIKDAAILSVPIRSVSEFGVAEQVTVGSSTF
jgi:hypothetical protein